MIFAKKKKSWCGAMTPRRIRWFLSLQDVLLTTTAHIASRRRRWHFKQVPTGERIPSRRIPSDDEEGESEDEDECRMRRGLDLEVRGQNWQNGENSADSKSLVHITITGDRYTYITSYLVLDYQRSTMLRSALLPILSYLFNINRESEI